MFSSNFVSLASSVTCMKKNGKCTNQTKISYSMTWHILIKDKCVPPFMDDFRNGF